MPGSWPHRVGHPRLAVVVSDATCGSYPAPSPRSLRIRVHPLVSLPPLQSPFAAYLPPSVSRRRPLPWVFSALIAASFQSGLHPGSQSQAPSVLGVSHALDGFDPTGRLQVYFTLLPRPGFTLQGFFLSAQPYRLVVGPSTLSSVGPACLRYVAIPLQLAVPRPQGFAPCGEFVGHCVGVTLRSARSPLGFFDRPAEHCCLTRPPHPPCGPLRPPTVYGFKDLARVVPTRNDLENFSFRVISRV